MTYTDLIFDLYGTLVDIHTHEDAPVWEKTALFFGYWGANFTGPALQDTFHRLLQARSAKAGEAYECYPDIPAEEIMAQIFREAGVTEDADALGIQAARLFRVCSTDYIRLYPHIPEALSALREKGYRLWLLSNAQSIFTRCELRHLGLEDAFDGIYLSSDFQCRKPDPRFLGALLREQKLDPCRCLMIGNDRNTDILGARSLGLGTLYLHTNLTPGDQAPADPKLHPAVSPGPHWELEDPCWSTIPDLF